MTEHEERWLEVSVVAKRLHRCQETVRRLIQRGHLKAIRYPGRTRFGNYMIPESALNDFLKAAATSAHLNTHP